MSQLNANAIPVSRSKLDVRTLASLSMFTALAYLAMLLSKVLPQVMFLQMEVKGVVICICGFLFGPVSAAVVSIAVAVIELFTVSDTMIMGCIMNALAACAFACPAAFVYRKMHTRKGAVMGLSLGVVTLVVVMLVWNFLLTPLYMEIDRALVVEMLPTLFLPFNLVKGGLNMALTLLLYKPIVTALRKARLVPESRTTAETGKRVNVGFVMFSLLLLATFVFLMLVLAGKV